MIESILNSTFLTTFINTLLSAIQGLIKVLLLPIDLLVKNLAPELSIEPITNLFETIGTFFGLILNYIWIPPAAISLMIAYILFGVMATAGAYFFKLVVKWYVALKP